MLKNYFENLSNNAGKVNRHMSTEAIRMMMVISAKYELIINDDWDKIKNPTQRIPAVATMALPTFAKLYRTASSVDSFNSFLARKYLDIK